MRDIAWSLVAALVIIVMIWVFAHLDRLFPFLERHFR
jgi:hypothetical protein